MPSTVKKEPIVETTDYLSLARRAATIYPYINRTTREDMVSHILYKIAKYIAEPDHINSLGMFMTIGHREAIRFMKRRELEKAVRSYGDMSDNSYEVEISDTFEVLISILSPRLRFIVTQYYAEGFSDREISEQLGVSTQRVNKQRETALKEMREHGTGP